jgi:outer membrane protein assembly factor BamB
MRGLLSPTMLCLGAIALCTGIASAQDWRTAGYDAQRSSWVRFDNKISTESVSGADFKLLWKMEFENEPRQMTSLSAPVLRERLVGYRGFRALAFFGSSSGRVFAVDTDLARVEWVKRLDSGPALADASISCPGGMTANITRDTRAEFPPPNFGGRGRRTAAGSGVGAPSEGAVTLRPSQAAARPNSEAPSPRVRAPLGNPNSGLAIIYAITSDGMLQPLHLSNGAKQLPPVLFLPPNAHARGLIVIDDTAYIATVNGCGGVADGIWALNLETKEVSHWEAPASSIAGELGFSIGSDGQVYASTADGSVAFLEAKTLRQTASYSPNSTDFDSTPIIVDFNNKDYVVVAAHDGTLHISGTGDSTARYQTTRSSVATSLATWKDSEGTPWVLAATADSIVNWKVVEREGGEPILERGWTKQIAAPLPPVIVNGVVFAAASGESRDSAYASARVRDSSSAKLYALDGATGETLWDSGDSITSFATGQGLTVGGGAVYITTYDGALYSFGFPIEH